MAKFNLKKINISQFCVAIHFLLKPPTIFHFIASDMQERSQHNYIKYE